MTCDGQNVDPIASEVRNSVDPIASEVRNSVDPIASEVRNSVDPIASEVRNSVDPPESGVSVNLSIPPNPGAREWGDYKDLNLKDFNSELNPTVETRGRAKAKTGNLAFGS